MLTVGADALDRPDELELRDNLHGEAIAFVSRLADDGNETSGAHLGTLMEACSPKAVVASQEIGRMMAEA